MLTLSVCGLIADFTGIDYTVGPNHGFFFSVAHVTNPISGISSECSIFFIEDSFYTHQSFIAILYILYIIYMKYISICKSCMRQSSHPKTGNFIYLLQTGSNIPLLSLMPELVLSLSTWSFFLLHGPVSICTYLQTKCWELFLEA